MDVAYINPFITATRHVFDTMVHVPFTLGQPHLRDSASSGAVAAQVGLSGSVTGSVVLYFPESVALALVSGLTGTPHKTMTEDCLDALGEIASMIAGNAKKDFPSEQVTISTPTVADPSSIKYPPKVPVIIIPCVTGKGRLAIEVSLKTSRRHRADAPASAAPAAPDSAATPA